MSTSLPPHQSEEVSQSEEVAVYISNVLDQLEQRTKELKVIREKYPFHLDVQDLHNCMNFHLNILKLAPQSGKSYHARQIALGFEGSGLDEMRCKGLYFSAMGFLFDSEWIHLKCKFICSPDSVLTPCG